MREAALAYGLTGLLRSLPFHNRRHKLYLPLDLLAALDLTPDEFFVLENDPRIGAARPPDGIARPRSFPGRAQRPAPARRLGGDAAGGSGAGLSEAAGPRCADPPAADGAAGRGDEAAPMSRSPAHRGALGFHVAMLDAAIILELLLRGRGRHRPARHRRRLRTSCVRRAPVRG